MNDNSRVAVLMLTHNAPRYVFKSVWTLCRRTSKSVPHELIVVDNASDFTTRLLVRVLWIFGFVDRLLCSKVNLMFAKGNNVAAGMASSGVTHYCLLNSDVEVRDPDWLVKLLGCMDGDTAIASFGAVEFEPIRADGFCLLIRRPLFDKYRLDESFEWWWSVTKLQAEVRREGYGVVSVRNHDGYVYHFGGKSRIDLTQRIKGMDIRPEKILSWFQGVTGTMRVVDECYPSASDRR